MLDGKQIADVVRAFEEEVLSQIAPDQAADAAADLDMRLRRDLLGDAVFGDIVFKDGYYYSTSSQYGKQKADSTPGLILRYLLDHEGETFSKDELFPNIPREDSTCSGALTLDVIPWVNEYSKVYEAFKEGYAPTKYGIRRIQEAPQDT